MKNAILFLFLFCSGGILLAQEEYSIKLLERRMVIPGGLQDVILYQDCDSPKMGIKNSDGDFLLPPEYTHIQLVKEQGEWLYTCNNVTQCIYFDLEGRQLIPADSHHFWTPDSKDLEECIAHQDINIKQSSFDKEDLQWTCYFEEVELEAAMFQVFTHIPSNRVLHFNQPVRYWNQDIVMNRLWVETEAFNYVFDLQFNLLAKTKYKILKVFRDHLMVVRSKDFKRYSFPFELRMAESHLYTEALHSKPCKNRALITYNGTMVFPFKHDYYGIDVHSSKEPVFWVMDEKSVSIYHQSQRLQTGIELLPKSNVKKCKTNPKTNNYHYYVEYYYLDQLADSQLFGFYFTYPNKSDIGLIKTDGTIVYEPKYSSIVSLSSGDGIINTHQDKEINMYQRKRGLIHQNSLPLAVYQSDSMQVFVNNDSKSEWFIGYEAYLNCIGERCYPWLTKDKSTVVLSQQGQSIFPDSTNYIFKLNDSLLIVHFSTSQGLYNLENNAWSLVYSAESIQPTIVNDVIFFNTTKGGKQILLDHSFLPVFTEEGLKYYLHSDTLIIVEYEQHQSLFQKNSGHWDLIHKADSFIHISGTFLRRGYLSALNYSGSMSFSDNWMVVDSNQLAFYYFYQGKWQKNPNNRMQVLGKYTEFGGTEWPELRQVHKKVYLLVDSNYQVVLKNYEFIQQYGMGYWVKQGGVGHLRDENLNRVASKYSFTQRQFGPYFEFEENGKFGLYHATELRIVLPANAYERVDFVENQSIKRGHKMYSLDGEFLFDTEHTSVTQKSGGFLLERNNKFGFFYRNKLLIPIEYDKITIGYRYLILEKPNQLTVHPLDTINKPVTGTSIKALVRGRGGSRFHIIKNEEDQYRLLFNGVAQTAWLRNDNFWKDAAWSTTSGFYGPNTIYRYRGIPFDVQAYLMRAFYESDSLLFYQAYGDMENTTMLSFKYMESNYPYGSRFGNIWIKDGVMEHLKLEDVIIVNDSILKWLNVELQSFTTNSGVKVQACYDPEFLKVLHQSFCITREGLRFVYHNTHSSNHNVIVTIPYPSLQKHIPKNGFIEQFLEMEEYGRL